jgi:hypothetical protein
MKAWQGMEFNLTLKSSREPASTTEDTNLLNSLQWESLQQRRWKQTLVMCYNIHHQLIAIEPANYYTAGDSRTRGNVQYIHQTAALSFICVVMKAWQGMEFNLTLKSSREPASITV